MTSTCTIAPLIGNDSFEFIQSCTSSDKILTIKSAKIIINIEFINDRFNPENMEFAQLNSSEFTVVKDRDFSGEYELKIFFKDETFTNIIVAVTKFYANQFSKCTVISNTLTEYGKVTEETITPRITTCTYDNAKKTVRVHSEEVINGIMFYELHRDFGVNINDDLTSLDFSMDYDFQGIYMFVIDWGKYRTEVEINIERN